MCSSKKTKPKYEDLPCFIGFTINLRLHDVPLQSEVGLSPDKFFYGKKMWRTAHLTSHTKTVGVFSCMIVTATKKKPLYFEADHWHFKILYTNNEHKIIFALYIFFSFKFTIFDVSMPTEHKVEPDTEWTQIYNRLNKSTC